MTQEVPVLLALPCRKGTFFGGKAPFEIKKAPFEINDAYACGEEEASLQAPARGAAHIASLK